MWCSRCQQDVPALASPEDDRVRCVKCRSEMISRVAEMDHDGEPAKWTPNDKSDESEPDAPVVEPPPFDFDAWGWDELREASRAVHTWGAKPTTAENSIPLPHREQRSHIPRSLVTTRTKSAPPRPKRSRHLAYFSWTALSLGIMACVFGGVLLAWSFLTDRAELWSLGLPFAIGGQVGLVLGLILQLDGLWQSNHEAAESLSNLDEQLVELRRATSQISSSHSGPSQSFYFHLAEGCSPHMLLADLKGQLDLLAMRIADQK